MAQISDEELMNEVLANQIPEVEDTNQQSPVISEEPVIETGIQVEPESNTEVVEQPVQQAPINPLAGQKISFRPGDRASMISQEEKDAAAQIAQERHITRAGENLFKNAELRDGWIPVDRDKMGLRSYFYPEDWQFRIRPATVEAIRNWSNIDETNPFAVDDVLNEVLKACLSIVTSQGQIPWGNVNSWDRLYFLLLIREFTFINGENKLKYDDDCPECDNPVTFELTSNSLLYDYPDEEIIKYYDINQRCWMIDPVEYEVDHEPVYLYLPTLEKDSAIKAWYIDRVQNQPNKKTEQAFVRFLPWMTPKISKDLDISKKQIKSLEATFKSWDIEMFTFMDEVLKNIIVTPKDKLIMTCPVCGEEVTAQIRFPNNISDLFNVQNKHRKFGTK